MFAFFFESVGGGEWLVLLAVILIVVGPKNLPSAARKMGKMMSQLRRAADEFKRQLLSMDEEMKKVGEDLKKEYVDIPESTGSTGSGDGTTATAEDYGDPYPGNMPGDHYGDYGYGDGSEDRAEAESAAAEAGADPEPAVVSEPSPESAPTPSPASVSVSSKPARGFEPVSAGAADAPAAPKISISVSTRRGAKGAKA